MSGSHARNGGDDDDEDERGKKKKKVFISPVRSLIEPWKMGEVFFGAAEITIMRTG